jgi:hypothetical protein
MCSLAHTPKNTFICDEALGILARPHALPGQDKESRTFSGLTPCFARTEKEGHFLLRAKLFAALHMSRGKAFVLQTGERCFSVHRP